MKTDVFNIEKGQTNLEKILNEAEKVAVYNGLDHKDTLQLRLLAEELVSLLPTLTNRYEGDFWIETENNVFKLKASFKTDKMNSDLKNELLEVSTSKENASAVGVIGKIRSAFDGLMMNMDNTELFAGPIHGVETVSVQYMDVMYSRYWSLEKYKESVNNKEKENEKDELEKSIIAKIADEVIVGIKGNFVDIIIIKKFD